MKETKNEYIKKVKINSKERYNICIKNSSVFIEYSQRDVLQSVYEIKNNVKETKNMKIGKETINSR